MKFSSRWFLFLGLSGVHLSYLRWPELWYCRADFHKSRFVLCFCIPWNITCYRWKNIYFLSQENLLFICSAREKVANCLLETCQCEAIHLSDMRTRKHSGCLGFFCSFSLESATNHCNLLLFLLSFQLSSSFAGLLSVLWKKKNTPTNQNTTDTQLWNKTMCGSACAQENKMTIAVVNLIWQLLILEYLTVWP